MTSANLLIGEGLSMKGYEDHVLPALEDKGYKTINRQTVDDGRHSRILATITGDGDLEQAVNDVLVRVGEDAESARIEKGGNFTGLEVWQMQVAHFVRWEGEKPDMKQVYAGTFEVVGLYESDSTAGELFPALAQRYLLPEVEKKISDARSALKAFGNSLSKV